MMNEEEIIKYLKTIKPKNFNNYKDETLCKLVTKKQIKAIEGLLDLYNKEKEKNKTLETLLQGTLYEMYKYYKDLCNSYQANCISKDKIREKIEDFKNLKKEILRIEEQTKNKSITYDIVRNDYCEKMLEELLKED